MSSFRKRSLQKPIPGTKTSAHNGQVITSSGNPSLDYILGGGLPMGSILLVEEDKFTTYSKVLAKYFLAEGIISDQSTFLGSIDDEPEEFLRKLPKPVNEDDKTSNCDPDEPIMTDSSGMRIAWRYNDLPRINSEQSSSKIGHNFNLLDQMDPVTLDRADVTVWSGQNQSSDSDQSTSTYIRLLMKISALLKESRKFANESSIDRGLLRICLTSIASPLWFDGNYMNNFLKFIITLKSLVRNFSTVCFISVPTHLIKKFDENVVLRIRNIVDYSIELEAFAGSDKEANPTFKEYNGILYLKKLSAVNTLAPYTPETTDLAFKLRRKKFVIEKLHLPPDLQESNEKNDAPIVSSLSCGTTANSLLDF